LILLLDTSALVKLLVDEPGSDDVLAWLAQADVIACAELAFPEAVSAIMRRVRSREIDPAASEQAVRTLEQEWEHILQVAVDCSLAGQLARRHPLSGADAVHLAAAISLWREGLAVELAGFDVRMNRAAAAEGLRVRGPME